MKKGELIRVVSNTALFHEPPRIGSIGIYIDKEFDLGQTVCIVLIDGRKFQVNERDIRPVPAIGAFND